MKVISKKLPIQFFFRLQNVMKNLENSKELVIRLYQLRLFNSSNKKFLLDKILVFKQHLKTIFIFQNFLYMRAVPIWNNIQKHQIIANALTNKAVYFSQYNFFSKTLR